MSRLQINVPFIPEDMRDFGGSVTFRCYYEMDETEYYIDLDFRWPAYLELGITNHFIPDHEVDQLIKRKLMVYVRKIIKEGLDHNQMMLIIDTDKAKEIMSFEKDLPQYKPWVVKE